MYTFLDKVIDFYGSDMQLIVAIEEFSELIKEISKVKRGCYNREHMLDEIADCYVMLKQLSIIFDLSFVDIHTTINKKISRLKHMLNERDLK